MAVMQTGADVEVPWGVGQARAKVRAEYGPKGHRRVLVEVPVLGPNGEDLGESFTVSLPAGLVRLIEP